MHRPRCPAVSRPRRSEALAVALILALLNPGGGAHASALYGAAASRVAVISNVQVSHDDVTSYGQPALAVNPRNPSNLLGVAWTAQDTEETFVSFDGGRIWRDNGPLPLPAGVSFGGDPSVAFDARGVGFVATLGESQTGDGVYVWRSDDGGRRFHLPVPVVQGQPTDHPWLAVDPSSGQGGGDLYVAWATRDVAGLSHAGGLAFSRSIDGGRSFAAPGIISAPTSGVSIPVVAAGPHGAVSIAYATLRRASQRGSTATGTPSDDGSRASTNAEEVEVVSSTDHGRSFGRPVVVGPMISLLSAGLDVKVTSQPSLAIDPRDGSIYTAYSAYVERGHADVVLARSQDGGRSWGATVRVTAGLPRQAIPFQPHVVVDDQGVADVTFFVLAHGRVDLVLTRSTRGVVGPPQRITNTSFDPSLGWHTQKTGAWWIGDYQGLAAGGGVIHPFWGDTSTGQLEIFTAAIPTTAVGSRQKESRR